MEHPELEILSHVNKVKSLLEDWEAGAGTMAWAMFFAQEMNWLTTYWNKGIEEANKLTWQ